MSKLAVFYHPDSVLHDTGPSHPETVDRARWIAEAIKEDDAIQEDLQWIKPSPVDVCWIEKVHSSEYRQYIEESCLSGRSCVDLGDTRVGMDSYSVALLAAGAAVQAVDGVLSDRFPRAFCCMRPPGHHARYEQAMGFCLFNNVAIAARFAEVRFGLERIAIVDWDVHHGNGTQEAFYNSPRVMFASMHQLPLYPHSGERHEEGLELGHGYTLNFPMPTGTGSEHWRRVFESELEPALEEFEPELLLVSAGFDAHTRDPLADVHLVEEDYEWMTLRLRMLADEYAKGRVVSVLEGGYDRTGLTRSALAHVRAMV